MNLALIKYLIAQTGGGEISTLKKVLEVISVFFKDQSRKVH